MKTLRALLLAPLLFAPVALHADEVAIKALLHDRIPRLKVEDVRPTPFPGLYEVYANDTLFYTDELANYLIRGALVDTRTQKNLSAERMQELEKHVYSTLPFDKAIKIVKGDGSRQIAIFEDPDCPFCRQLEGELAKVDNLTVYVFLFPIEALHPGATEKSRKIWCSPDPAQSWLKAVHSDFSPANPGSCDAPIDALAQLGQKLRITGTPTIFFPDGRRVAGAVRAERLETLFKEAPKDQPKS